MFNQTKPKILVTSAAGRTGSVAVTELLKKGFPVRAIVRREDLRAQRLRQLGAEVFVGNIFDIRDLRNAMQGVQRAYHCPPFAPNLLNNTMLFAIAAEEAKLEVVALLSQWNPHPRHPSTITREHWIANNIYRLMPTVDVIHINPGLFAFTYLLSLPMIVHFAMLNAPLGEGKNAPPSNEDIGKVAAGVLTDPTKHVGRCYRPTGPKLLDPNEIADVLTKVLGRKVKYQNAHFSMFAKAARVMGYPNFEIANIRYYLEELRSGAFAMGAPTEHVKEVTGEEAEDFESIARRYIANPSLIAPTLKVGTKLEAIYLLLKVLITPAPNIQKWQSSQSDPMIQNAELAHEHADWRMRAKESQLLVI